MPPLLVTVSERSAKTKPFGIVAPSRFNMIGCGIATTSAMILREPAGHGTTWGGAAAFAFAGSDSVLMVVTAGVSSLVVAVGVALTAFGSTVVFSTATVGVCAASSEAVIKIRMIAANEVTKDFGIDLKPCIYFSLFAFA